MSFNPNDPRLTEYVFGELRGGERDRFEEELEHNDALRLAVEQLRATVGTVAEVLGAEPAERLRPHQLAAVESAIAGVGQGQQPGDSADAQVRASRPRHRLRRAVAVMALAASLLLACGLGYWLGSGRVTQLAAAGNSSSNPPDRSSDQPTRDARQPTWAPSTETSGKKTAVALSQNDATGQPVATAERPRQAGELQLMVTPRTVEAAPATNEPVSPSSRTESIEAAGRVAGSTEAMGLPYRKLSAAGDESRELLRRSTARNRRGPMEPQTVTESLQQLNEGTNHYYSYSAAESRTRGQRGSIEGPGMGGGGIGGGPMVGGMMGGERYGAGLEGNHSHRAELFSLRDRNGGTEVDPLSERTRLTLELGREAIPPSEGVGPEFGGDEYLPSVENPFREAINAPLSTFSIDVDTASYAKTRMYLLEQNSLPRPDAVRIEELLNYFVYDYATPEDGRPFAARVETATCPWAPQHRLVRVALKGREIPRDERPTSNLVFLLDVSGSMRPENKLPLVKRGMKQLVDQLGENDRVAIVVYAGAAGMVLEPTPGSEKQRIFAALDQLQAGGSTNGGQGIHLAYKTARENFFEEGVNRVILCTDGDFNVGTTGTDQLVELAQENAKTGVFLSVLGFGMGNHNDAMLEQISNQGNGNYAFIDTSAEARKVLVEQLSGTLVTIAKDVKIQVEMNPARVAAYRLVGYENRVLAAEDFNDDKKDAGEIGAGHSVTALYEIVPAGEQLAEPPAEVDELKYQVPARLSEAAESDELLTLKLRYKQPDGDTSQLIRFPVRDEGREFEKASRDFQFASAVASFGMLLRGSKYCGNATYDAVLEIATAAAGEDPTGYRGELLEMVRRAKELTPVPPAATDEPVSEE